MPSLSRKTEGITLLSLFQSPFVLKKNEKKKESIESSFWKNRVEKEISALKRVSNAEKKNRKREKAALKKVSNARKKNQKSKIKNTTNTTLYSTLFPRLTSLSHKKPAKNTYFTPTESLQAPACQPPSPACLHVLSAKRVSEDRRPPVNHRSPPAGRLFSTESWDFPNVSAGARRHCPTTRQSPARSFIHLGDTQIPAGDRLPFP